MWNCHFYYVLIIYLILKLISGCGKKVSRFSQITNSQKNRLYKGTTLPPPSLLFSSPLLSSPSLLFSSLKVYKKLNLCRTTLIHQNKKKLQIWLKYGNDFKNQQKKLRVLARNSDTTSIQSFICVKVAKNIG